MKKILCLIVPIFLLCGCASKTQKITPVTKGLSFNAQIMHYNEAYECNVNIAKNGDTEVAFSLPENLSGLKVFYSGDSVTAEFKGIKYTALAQSLPQYSVSDTIYNIFSTNYTEVFEKNDSYFVNYSGNDGEYKMFIGATGLPIKITSPFFEAKIKNATIK